MMMKKSCAGSRVGEYILDEKIGEGGFGEVWKAHHAELPHKVAAVKLPTDEAYVKELRSEAVFQHTLEHPNIVRTLGLNTAGDQPYFVEEYIPGESLRSVLCRAGRLPLSFTLVVMKQVLLALSHAHGKGVVHRDIKPSNILIASGGRGASGGETAEGLPHNPMVKLTDFGIGQTAVVASSIMLSVSGAQSEDKSISGTIEYMSPEQRRGEKPDPRADIYSLGIVFFEMLTGSLPQPGDKPSDYIATLPGWVDKTFEKCFTRPERRYASAAEMLGDIERRVSIPAPSDETVIGMDVVPEEVKTEPSESADKIDETMPLMVVRDGPMCSDRRCTGVALRELVCPVCGRGACKDHFTSRENQFWHEREEKVGDSTFPYLGLLFCVHCNGVVHVGCASRKGECRKCGAAMQVIYSTGEDENVLSSSLMKAAALKAVRRWGRAAMCVECDRPSELLTCKVCRKGACKEHFFKVFSAGRPEALYCQTCAAPVHQGSCSLSRFLKGAACRKCNSPLKAVSEKTERDAALVAMKMVHIARQAKGG